MLFIIQLCLCEINGFPTKIQHWLCCPTNNLIAKTREGQPYFWTSGRVNHNARRSASRVIIATTFIAIIFILVVIIATKLKQLDNILEENV